MCACRCNRSGQASACSVVTVPFELDMSVDHSVQCRSLNSMQTSSSCANWENLLQRCYRLCNKFTVILHWRNPHFTTDFPVLRMERCWRMTSAAGGLWHPELEKWLRKCDTWFDLIDKWPSWKWSKKLVSLMNRLMPSYPTIWRWDLSVQSLCRGSWAQIRWTLAW